MHYSAINADSKKSVAPLLRHFLLPIMPNAFRRG